MSEFTLQELRDLLSTVFCDVQGTHGDERSQRLDKLENKLRGLILEAREEATV